MDLLVSLTGKTLEKVLYHEWTCVEYTSLDWIQLVFSDRSTICFNIGSNDATIDVLDSFDPQAEQKELFEMFGERDVTVKTTDRSDTRKWKNYIGEKVTGYRIEESDDGLLKSVSLLFGERSVKISAGQDNLEAKALSK
ncbi:MAG: hypothetical protein WAX07_00905 [Candidatus Altiarchaeia archaeon]